MMVRLTEEPTDDRFWWWLPQFLADEPDNEKNWSIVHCSSGNGAMGRVGVFVGPLKPPIYEKSND